MVASSRCTRESRCTKRHRASVGGKLDVRAYHLAGADSTRTQNHDLHATTRNGYTGKATAINGSGCSRECCVDSKSRFVPHLRHLTHRSPSSLDQKGKAWRIRLLSQW